MKRCGILMLIANQAAAFAGVVAELMARRVMVGIKTRPLFQRVISRGDLQIGAIVVGHAYGVCG